MAGGIASAGFQTAEKVTGSVVSVLRALGAIKSFLSESHRARWLIQFVYSPGWVCEGIPQVQANAKGADCGVAHRYRERFCRDHVRRGLFALILVLGWSEVGVAADEAEQEKEAGDESQIASAYEPDVGRADGADLEEIEPEAFSEDEEYSDVEEVKVTGVQGGQLVQIGVSEIGFDACELQRDGIEDIRDLSNSTPNLEIKSAFAASNATLFIRGVGIDDFNANAPVRCSSIRMTSTCSRLRVGCFRSSSWSRPRWARPSHS